MLFIEGYSDSAHLGISAIFWWILILQGFIMSIFWSYKAVNSKLVNQRQLYIGCACLHLAQSNFLFMQLGFMFPSLFVVLFSIGAIIADFLISIFIYYFEKICVNLKKIPTIIGLSGGFFLI